MIANATLLQLIESLPGYSKGLLNANASKLLLTELTDNKTTSDTIEVQWPKLQPTGLSIKGAKLVLYHHDQVIYLNQDNELIRLVNSQQQLITNNLITNNIATTALIGDKLYYVDQQTKDNSIAVIDLKTGIKTSWAIDSTGIKEIEMINQQLFIRVEQTLKPKIVIGDIVYQ